MIKQLIKTPLILQKFFPGLIWQLETNEKKLHLTFDDGPHKSITPWVLNCLKNFNAKATKEEEDGRNGVLNGKVPSDVADLGASSNCGMAGDLHEEADLVSDKICLSNFL